MHRRSVIQGLVSGAVMAIGRVVGLGAAAQAKAEPGQTPDSKGQPKAPARAAATRPIQLHCDLAVDPKREAEMLKHFETVFKPTAEKQKGYIDLKMNKLNTAVRGKAPTQFRFVLTFESEALRQVWINSADHARVWPPIEDTLTDKNFSILVYDVY